MSKIEYTQYMDSGKESAIPGVFELQPVDQVRARISSAKQVSHDQFSIFKEKGGFKSPGQVIGDTLSVSSFYVGETPSGNRVVFGIIPSIRVSRSDELPVDILMAHDYAQRLGMLRAISGAEYAGQIGAGEACEQAGSVLGYQYSEPGAERGSISPDAAIGILREQRLRETTKIGRQHEICRPRRTHVSASAVHGAEVPANVWVIPQEEEKIPKGGRRINKVVYAGAGGLAVGSLILTACAPVTPEGRVNTYPSPENTRRTENVTHEPVETAIASAQPTPEATESGNFGLATPTDEWPGDGVDVVNLAEELNANNGLVPAQDIEKESEAWNAIKSLGGDIDGLYLAILNKLNEQGRPNVRINAVQSTTGGWGFEIRAGDGSLMWSVIEGENNQDFWQDHPNRITEDSRFQKLDPGEIGLMEGERLELALHEGTPMGIVVDEEGRVNGIFDPRTAAIHRFQAAETTATQTPEPTAVPTPTPEAWRANLPAGARNPGEADGQIVAYNNQNRIGWYYDSGSQKWLNFEPEAVRNLNSEIFSPDTTNEFKTDNFEFTFRLSTGILSRSGQTYVRLPEDRLREMSLRSAARFMFLQRDYFPERYADFFKVEKGEVDPYSGEFLDMAEQNFSQGPAPVVFAKYHPDISGAFSEIEMNLVSKEEFFSKVVPTLDQEGIDHGRRVEWLDRFPNGAAWDSDAAIFLEGNKLVIYAYDLGSPEDRGGAHPQIPLELLYKDHDKMYFSLFTLWESATKHAQFHLQSGRDAEERPRDALSTYRSPNDMYCGPGIDDTRLSLVEFCRPYINYTFNEGAPLPSP